MYCKFCNKNRAQSEFVVITKGVEVHTERCQSCRSQSSGGPPDRNVDVIENGVKVATIYNYKDSTGRGRLYVHSFITHSMYSLPRVLMSARLKRALSSEEVVHHTDGNPMNNSPTNLEVISKREHSSIHMEARQRRKRLTHK